MKGTAQGTGAELEPTTGEGCYLICADRPLETGKHPRHYIGYSRDLAGRIYAHRRNRGSRLIQVWHERGIGWNVVRVWLGAGPRWERQLKNRGHYNMICPECSGAVALNRAGRPTDPKLSFEELYDVCPF